MVFPQCHLEEAFQSVHWVHIGASNIAVSNSTKTGDLLEIISFGPYEMLLNILKSILWILRNVKFGGKSLICGHILDERWKWFHTHMVFKLIGALKSSSD